MIPSRKSKPLAEEATHLKDMSNKECIFAPHSSYPASMWPNHPVPSIQLLMHVCSCVCEHVFSSLFVWYVHMLCAYPPKSLILKYQVFPSILWNINLYWYFRIDDSSYSMSLKKKSNPWKFFYLSFSVLMVERKQELAERLIGSFSNLPSFKLGKHCYALFLST
jgi:hypothetical protein